MTSSNPWLLHLKKYHEAHPENSYKVNMQKAKATYKPKQSGKGAKPSPIGAIAGAVGSVADLGGQIASQVQHRRDASGFYDSEGLNRAQKDFVKLKWRRDSALLDKNKIPKSWSDAKLARMSGLDRYS